jgi:ubiquinone/menaquinone biosynthesis C-methylase UbiE
MPDDQVSLQEYWNLRAPSYNVIDVYGRKVIKAYLEKSGIHPKSLIDIGTGKGELLHIFTDVPNIVALDFSSEMLKFAKRRIERHEWKNVKTIQQDLTKGYVLFNDKEKFDLLTCRTVLMHIHPDEIETACDNVAKMSDNLLLLELFSPEVGKEFSSHNWSHDYPKLFDSRGYKMEEAYNRPDLEQVLFIFRKR